MVKRSFLENNIWGWALKDVRGGSDDEVMGSGAKGLGLQGTECVQWPAKSFWTRGSSVSPDHRSADTWWAWLCTVKAAAEAQWVWDGCLSFPLRELLLGDSNNVKTEVSPWLAMVVSDQQSSFGVTSHSLPHLHHLVSSWLRIPERRWPGFTDPGHR